MILLDTNILIEILKGDAKTVNRVESLSGRAAISSISAMELYYGAFDKAEIRKLERFVSLFEVVPIDQEISVYATKLVKTYAKSHNLDIPDALIAATAIVKNHQLLTYNIKDFRYIKNLKLI